MLLFAALPLFQFFLYICSTPDPKKRIFLCFFFFRPQTPTCLSLSLSLSHPAICQTNKKKQSVTKGAPAMCPRSQLPFSFHCLLDSFSSTFPPPLHRCANFLLPPCIAASSWPIPCLSHLHPFALLLTSTSCWEPSFLVGAHYFLREARLVVASALFKRTRVVP